MQTAGTMVFQENSKPGQNQVGDGMYLAEKLGVWGENGKTYVTSHPILLCLALRLYCEMFLRELTQVASVCLFAADTAKLTAVEKVKYPQFNRQGNRIQGKLADAGHTKGGKYAREFWDEIGADWKKALRISVMDSGTPGTLQLTIRETMCGTLDNPTHNPLGITIVECAPWEEKDHMVNKDVVVDFKAFPGMYKGWLASETPPATCGLNARARSVPKSGCLKKNKSATPTKTKSAKLTKTKSPRPKIITGSKSKTTKTTQLEKSKSKKPIA
jgi:hypothetical protein